MYACQIQNLHFYVPGWKLRLGNWNFHVETARKHSSYTTGNKLAHAWDLRLTAGTAVSSLQVSLPESAK